MHQSGIISNGGHVAINASVGVSVVVQFQKISQKSHNPFEASGEPDLSVKRKLEALGLVDFALFSRRIEVL